MHLELIISLFGTVGVIIWQAAWHSSRIKRLEEQSAEQNRQIDRLRARHHEKVAPTLQGLVFKVGEIEERIGPHRPTVHRQLPSWEDLDDSRVTNDPEKESKK